jgi:hypothetical protein
MFCFVSNANAQLSDIKGTYTTGDCADSAARMIIKEDAITGADFRCSIGQPQQIGTGLAGFEAACSTKHGQGKRGLFVIDFSEEPALLVSIPGINARYKAEEWIRITRC